jgi:hypothetical protein
MVRLQLGYDKNASLGTFASLYNDNIAGKVEKPNILKLAN